uniref:Fibrinogen C-terminal domain-containing protein n=1 Tax=Anopheles farauti TaxID=69004 RepID=A0A182QP40_9DIPT
MANTDWSAPPARKVDCERIPRTMNTVSGVVAIVVVFGLMTVRLQATNTPTGFGYEMLLAHLQAFESRTQAQLELLQQNVKQSRQELASLQRYTTEQLANKDSGVYFVNFSPTTINASFEVFRDGSDNHGYGANWTVFQRRFDGSVNFNRSWTEYRNGFGDVRREHWLGLEKLRMLLDRERHELLIVMEDFEGVTAFAHYDNFAIGNESNDYQLKSLGTHTGIVGDSFSSQLMKKFATVDRDSPENCAQTFQSGGWFSNCYQSEIKINENGHHFRNDPFIRCHNCWYIEPRASQIDTQVSSINGSVDDKSVFVCRKPSKSVQPNSETARHVPHATNELIVRARVVCLNALLIRSSPRPGAPKTEV